MASLIRRYAGAFQLVFVIGIVGLALLVSAAVIWTTIRFVGKPVEE